jgi:hypothetical protein
MSRRDEINLDAFDAELLEAWREGDHLSTLDLRAAQHAAEREGATSDANALSALISDREALGQ